MIQIHRRVPSKISTIMVGFDAGARAEGKKFTPGIAHFLEHMVFKGTESRTYLEIPKQIAFLGGEANAFTSQDVVAFYITVPYENTEKAVEILSDMLFNSIFPEEEFIKEKEVIKEEELSSQDSVDSFIWDKFSESFFSHRLSIPVIGTQESIEAITLPELKKFHSKHYRKSEAVVTLCSNHSKRDGRRILKKYFGKASGKIKNRSETHEPAYFDAREMEIHRHALEHTYVWIAYPGNPMAAPGEAVEDMLLSILGHGMDSRLFTEVREKHGLCYGIGAFNVGYRDSAAIVISSSTRGENLAEMKAMIDAEITKLKTELVTDEELERARNKYRATSYAIHEGSYPLAKNELYRALFGLPPLEELEKQVNSVTPEDIRKMAQQLFDDSKKLTLICKAEEE